MLHAHYTSLRWLIHYLRISLGHLQPRYACSPLTFGYAILCILVWRQRSQQGRTFHSLT